VCCAIGRPWVFVLLLLRRITPLPRRNAVYFCSGAYTQALPTDPTNPNCGTGCVLNTTPEGDSFIPADILAPDTTYYWEVHARSPLQYGAWSSPTFSFTTAGPELTNLSIIPSTVPSGNSSTVAAVLTGPAPNGGVIVGLSSTNQSAFPVTNISIPAGSVMGSIAVQAGTVSASTTVTVTASYNNSYANATVTVNPIGGSGTVLRRHHHAGRYGRDLPPPAGRGVENFIQTLTGAGRVSVPFIFVSLIRRPIDITPAL
jgi:hypothetical protein